MWYLANIAHNTTPYFKSHRSQAAACHSPLPLVRRTRRAIGSPSMTIGTPKTESWGYTNVSLVINLYTFISSLLLTGGLTVLNSKQQWFDVFSAFFHMLTRHATYCPLVFDMCLISGSISSTCYPVHSMNEQWSNKGLCRLKQSPTRRKMENPRFELGLFPLVSRSILLTQSKFLTGL